MLQLQRLSVPFEYPVYFTRDVFAPANPVLATAIRRREPETCHRALFLVDRGVAAARPKIVEEVGLYVRRHPATIALAGPVMVLPGGEACKNDPLAVPTLHRELHRLGMDRHAFVVIVGGGAFLDMAGYAAATAHRGLRVVRLPTTVLAQDDAGVGVKNGVNAFGAKNFLGTFAPPFAVINDVRFLETLDPRDRIAGLAEAVKVALIRDPAFFAWLEGAATELRSGDEPALGQAVERAARLHLEHIARGGDPFEMGSARPLDYGHWAAHKLETLSEHELRHGEAVAIGMALDARYAATSGLLPHADAERIERLLTRLGFRLWHRALERPSGRAQGGARRLALLDGLDEFREHLGGQLTLTLLTGIGRSVEVHAVDESKLLAALDGLRRAHAGDLG